EDAITKALAIQRKNGEVSTVSFARKLNNLAKVRQMAGDPAKAVPLLEQALSIFRKAMGKDSPEYATSAYNLGVAYWKAGKAETGFKYLKVSASIRARVLGKKHPKYAESMLKIGEYQWYKKAVKDAQQSFGEVFDNHYFQIDQTFPVLTEEEKSKFFYTNIRDSFDKFNSFALAERIENPGLIKDVYDYLINTKAAIMLATEKVKTAIRESGDTALIARFESWQAKKEQIAKLYSLNQEHGRLDSLLKEANVLEKDLTRQSAAFAAHLIRKKFTWKDIQSTLRPGEAAVEVLRFKSYSPMEGGIISGTITYAFLVITPKTKDQPDLILLGNGNDLETKLLKFYRNNVKFQVPDLYSYKNYFEPLGDYLKKENITRVYFSPDGVYNQININGIENPFSKKYLVDEYDIRFVTNTRELAEARWVGKNKQSSVLIGFPKYNLEYAALGQNSDKKATRGGNLSRTWRGGLLRYMRGEEGISILPGTQVEIEKIAKLFGESSSVYTEDQATERAAKSVSNPTFLHIATHGYFLEDAAPGAESNPNYVANPLLNAGLILAGAENFLKTGEPTNDAGDDGILTAYEAMNLKLDMTQLVVLSACETGLGDVKNGEGVYGLQRAFKLAGARSIIMSLWNVDDEATQQLMTTFYDEMIRTGDQHQAFRKAQQAVKDKFDAPFYWAAFIMVGI
ncbi:MAG TPA: CHAT domain-containing tetratricopeptide repeat protein, partial [Chryseosolibacter sp.]|nr:CHAT domain-containing tetratricopeptide repeat protein [Chryseosolibacter sp.]